MRTGYGIYSIPEGESAGVKRVGFVVLAEDWRDALNQFAKACEQPYEVKRSRLEMTTVNGIRFYLAVSGHATDEEYELMLGNPLGLNCRVIVYNK